MGESPHTPPLALVTGATGALGPTLLALLLSKGWRLRVLLQPGDVSSMPSDSIEVIEGDITDPRALANVADGVDYVFHLAAKLHINNPSPEMKAAYERVNVQGTQGLVDAARKANVRRFVFFSTISVYGPSQASDYHTEKSPLNPRTYYAETKAQAEQIVLEARRSDDGEPFGTVLRLAAVYGARIKGNYARLWRAIQKGYFLPVGQGQNRRTLVYDKDVALAAWLAATHPNAVGHRYNVTDGDDHTLAEVITTMRETIGKPAYALRIPLSPVRAVAQFVTATSKWLGKPIPATDLLNKYLEDVAVDGSAIQQELGFKPEYDLAKGWRDLHAMQRSVD